MKIFKSMIFCIVLSIALSGSGLLNNILVYADDYEDYDNDYYYGDEDNGEDYYWKNYWDNQNNQINQDENNDDIINQDNEWHTQPDNQEETNENDPETPAVDMTKVTLEKDYLEGVMVGGGYYGDVLLFNIKVNSEVILNDEENAYVRLESSNEDMYFSSELENNILTIETGSVGKTTLKVTINDKEFKIKVKITSIDFKQNSYIIAKGKSENILITGAKNQKIKWKSSKPGIVSVSRTGKVKGLKEGNAIITAEIDGKKLAALVSSVSEIKKKAVNWATEYAGKSKYSQPKRMQNGYYDCSSLVWRAYNKFGHKLAGANYAPTAAELCRSYDRKKQTIKGGASYKNIEELKLLPGDLVFLSGEKNGRYKDVYHVEMIAGYEFYGMDSDGKPSVYIKYVRSGGQSDKMTVARVKLK